MIQIGDYQYGYEMNDAFNVNMERCAISYKGKTICSFPSEAGKEIARLMMSWHGLDAVNELSDDELISELRERGYSGKITKTTEI